MILQLSNELVLQIFHSCTSISDVVNLLLVCRRLHALLPASQKLSVLFKAAEAEFGPLEDAIQLVTWTQAAHVAQNPTPSFSLLRQITSVGRVAQRWQDLYPERKWRENFIERRSLNFDERYRLRRAIYRYWLFAMAFQNRTCSRSMRMVHSAVVERAQLLRNWSTEELLEIEDLRRVMQDFVASFIVPSDGHLQQSLFDRWPSIGKPQCLFTLSHMSSIKAAPEEFFYTFGERRSMFLSLQNLQSRACEGWGDDIMHYYVVQDMMKLDPGQILWLRENAPRKWQVESYIESQGEWFKNNGETFALTLQMMLAARGHDVQQVLDGVDTGVFGVAVEGVRTVPQCWGDL